ncbi:hypothetical protein HYV49_02080 [Candidatus Pacearchaeota archaeon]|nr:hypothetical protein [Candidatus Pacearchaeota archaeon]
MKKIILLSFVLTITVLSSIVLAALAVNVNNLRLVIGGTSEGTEKVSLDATITPVTPLSQTPADSFFEIFTLADCPLPPCLHYARFIPAEGLSTTDGTTYRLNDLGRSETGLERFELKIFPDKWEIQLLDTRATLPDVDYSEVMVCIEIQAQAFDSCGNVPMVHNGNVWQLNG